MLPPFRRTGGYFFVAPCATLVVSEAVLFAGFGSLAIEETDAVLVIVVLPFTMTVT
jgi:hypothetical protein